MREHVASLYPGPRWKARVNRMSEAQVFAILKAKQEHDNKKEGDK